MVLHLLSHRALSSLAALPAVEEIVMNILGAYLPIFHSNRDYADSHLRMLVPIRTAHL